MASFTPRDPDTAALLSRRDAVKTLGLGALFSLGLWPGALRAAGTPPPAGKFTFIAINDTHYLSPECGPWLEKVTGLIAPEKPDFVLHIGDVCDKGLKAQHLAVRDIFARLQVPMYPVIGNHDWTTQTDRSAYEEVFPNRINYTFEHAGWQFVGLDSSEGLRWHDTKIGDATFAWLDANLPKLDRQRPLVLFTHFPLIDGPSLRPITDKTNARMQPANANALLERFRDFNLQAVFNGHFHGYKEATFGAATITTNRCCALKRFNFDGTKEKGFFVCTAADGRVTRRFVEVKAEGSEG
ncbi:metallophosphoesterase [Opitutus sp. ER46]|uniref:metallophosphoesterase family protein n=1 Tax=Opitutus sp. ER46 TaxID=2161864 RepID=UPI000D30C5DC|nr:metallophosphoesterase [Opitutus sp. ER46]PTY00148.1 hypothetical protein DB354_02355 [Opitutus sp. ER46]